MPREQLEEKLAKLKLALLQMGSTAQRALSRSVKALAEADSDTARNVIAEDVQINQMQHDIEEACIEMLATEQPMARDLRFIVAVLNMAVELERIGDYAEGISKINLRMIGQPPLKPLVDIPRMAEIAEKMIGEVLQAFVDRDVTKARQVSAGDDELDALCDQVYRELLTFMIEDAHTIGRATYLIWVSHNLERAGDRATNMAERVLQLVTGRVEELNP